ncbi:AAA family ATPase [Microcoleus sp. AT8-B1]|uniref:AAA family ATPase n=1 Tax=unclassified Microcoleus TaxID=2642155 RepID=UPI002FD55B71
MEKVFVHPECPFSENTFNLLAQFSENPSSDFLSEHQKDLLKYVEEPVKYILNQVQKQLPDCIKKYIDIKQGSFSYIHRKSLESAGVYRGAYCSRVSTKSAQLMLKVENQRLTFGFEAQKEAFLFMLYGYANSSENDVNSIAILKRSSVYNKQPFYLRYSINEGDDKYFHYGMWPNVIPETKPGTCIYQLLDNIVEEIVIASRQSENVKLVLSGHILATRSLELKNILGYSDKQLTHKIAQTFKKVFPLFLISTNIFYDDDHDVPLLLSQYLSVHEKEFNPVYHLEEISEITGFQTTQLTQWIQAINRKGQTIIQGPPGTGKTFIAEKLAKHLIGGGDGFSDIIQFHPAYTYEDFIEGLRPINKNGRLTYSIVPGRFREFCEKAEPYEDTCVLIIDEINRANLSQVFGELMYLLDDRQDTKRSITLASGIPFKIPKNVRIIGTMNTADRSIALVDNALRRRFAFIPLYPNYELLQNYHNREKTGFAVDDLIRILKKVNQAISNKHYELGISFFLTKTLGEDIQDIWQMEIEPYLEEYFFDNLEKMDKFLWDKIKDELSN